MLLGVLRWYRGTAWNNAVLPAHSSRTFPLAVCDGTAYAMDVEVTGQLLLHRDFLSSGIIKPAEVEAAVQQQLRYAFAATQNDEAAVLLLTPSGPPSQIDILWQQDVPYGHALHLDWPADPEVHPGIDYVKKALQRRAVNALDAAVQLGYRARLTVAACSHSPKLPSQLTLPIPVDPYLLFWFVDPVQRALRVYGSKSAVTFPCAEDDLAEYEHPEYLWYYFQPTRTAPDCPRLLQSSRALAVAQLRVVSASSPHGSLREVTQGLRSAAREHNVLRIGALFGFVDHQHSRPTTAQVKECFDQLRPAHSQGESRCQEDELEWGALQYLRFVAALRGRLVDYAVAVVNGPPGGVFSVLITGKIPRSLVPVEVKVDLMETDFLAPAPYVPMHIPWIAQALQQQDVLLYAGHSGLGENLSVAKLVQALGAPKTTALLQRSTTQVVAFLGCYTYSYFGRDLAPLLRGGVGRETLFAYTGNAVSQLSQSALHVLTVLDCALASSEGSDDAQALAVCLKQEPKGNFLIYDYARSALGAASAR
jgi:hypothetical protein